MKIILGFTSKVLFESEKTTLKETLIEAVKIGTDLRGADLRGTDLRGANLNVKIPPINDHYFISEILRRESKIEVHFDLSARIRLQTDECWEYFIKLAKKKRVYIWAKEILCKWDEFKKKFR